MIVTRQTTNRVGAFDQVDDLLMRLVEAINSIDLEGIQGARGKQRDPCSHEARHVYLMDIVAHKDLP